MNRSRAPSSPGPALPDFVPQLATLARDYAKEQGYSFVGPVRMRFEGVPDLSTGDNVRHATLGAGIVTRIEADGVVTVRFEDGAERRLIRRLAICSCERRTRSV